MMSKIKMLCYKEIANIWIRSNICAYNVHTFIEKYKFIFLFLVLSMTFCLVAIILNWRSKKKKCSTHLFVGFSYGIFVLSIMNYSKHGWCDHSKIDSTCFNKNSNCVQEFGFFFIRMSYLSIGQTNNIINDEHVLFIFNM